ncbi:hypothetical protein E6O75_ATG00932 [Venturia nashicola]|uniref:Uncharacterized protein n=1 Tax=Venturia nashicola TaxID=86259 RepID=A0A4Z1PTW0_9PEZI|nr:hypothetical protein E6O75_ATG00932 [Venturia nashicola]
MSKLIPEPNIPPQSTTTRRVAKNQVTARKDNATPDQEHTYNRQFNYKYKLTSYYQIKNPHNLNPQIHPTKSSLTKSSLPTPNNTPTSPDATSPPMYPVCSLNGIGAAANTRSQHLHGAVCRESLGIKGETGAGGHTL